jgi:hypothetical protein
MAAINKIHEKEEEGHLPGRKKPGEDHRVAVVTSG